MGGKGIWMISCYSFDSIIIVVIVFSDLWSCSAGRWPRCHSGRFTKYMRIKSTQGGEKSVNQSNYKEKLLITWSENVISADRGFFFFVSNTENNCCKIFLHLQYVKLKKQQYIILIKLHLSTILYLRVFLLVEWIVLIFLSLVNF